MSGFNFGQIGNIISELFDTDYVDIKRDINGRLQEIYSNVICHISYSSVDNPNPETVDIKPIIQSLTIHFALWVDIKNNDFIIAKKMDNNGNLLAVYSGRCGNPIFSQGRQKVSIVMSATESENPTPVPPQTPAFITIEYFSNNIQIQDPNTYEIEKGEDFSFTAPLIDNYSAEDCEINGDLQGATTVSIKNVQNDYIIKFFYRASSLSNGFRFLVNGLYTKNDGKLANGYHLYKKINIDSVSENDNLYTIICDYVKIEHEDNGKVLSLEKGVKLVLVPNDIFVQIIDLSKNGNKVIFYAKEFIPTESEQNAYVTEWYG